MSTALYTGHRPRGGQWRDDATAPEPLLGQLALRHLGVEPLAESEHHRADSSGDEQDARRLEGEDVAGEDRSRDALDVAVRGRPGPALPART